MLFEITFLIMFFSYVSCWNTASDKVKMKVKLLSRVQLFATPWTVAFQAPQSMEIFQASVPEWVAISSSRVSPEPGIEPRSPTLQADALQAEPPGKPTNTFQII